MQVDKNFSALIKISRPPDVKISAGDIATVQVIKHLADNKWAVGFMGKVYPATTSLELHADQILKVRVIHSGKLLQLQIVGTKAHSAVLDTLKQLGLPTDALTQQIVAVLIRSAQGVEPALVRKIRERALKEQKTTESHLRMLANLAQKKLDLNAPGIGALLDLLDQQSGGRHQPGKREQELSPRALRKAFKEIIENGAGFGDNLLQVFNHLQGQPESWVIIPYQFLTADQPLTGDLRLLINHYNHEIRKAVLIVNTARDERWSFFMNSCKNYIQLLVFSNRKVYIDKKSKSFNALIANLQNIGIKIDDKIYDDKFFDGFYPMFPADEYKNVDTVI